MYPVRPYILQVPLETASQTGQDEHSIGNNWFYTYVLISEKDGNFYTVSTNDLIKRIEKHKNGLVSSTKYRLPSKLLRSS
jgi:hypothetical protein